MRQFRPGQFAALMLVVAAYAGARFWGLTSSCLWFDEIFSVHAAEHGWDFLFSFVALDLIHPPLFYVLLKLWIAAGGEGLLWLRLLPVLFALTAIFPFILLCIELKISFWTRLFALFLIAFNGSMIKYAQEVRMYSLLMCLSLFSIWLFARHFQKEKGLAALTIVNLLLVWTHYFGWFVVMSEVVAILIFQRIKWRAMAAMFALVLVGFVPWIVALATAAGNGAGLSQNIGWMMRPGIIAMAQFKLNLIEPFYFQASNIDPFSIYRVSVPLLAIVSVAAVFFLVRWKEHPADQRRALELMALMAILPAIAAFVASWLLPYSIWGTRHLIIVFAPMSVTIAVILSNVPFYKLRLAGITLVILFTGYAFVVKAARPTPQYIWCGWEQLINRLDPGASAHIYAAEDVIAYHLWFAARHEPTVRVTKLEMGVPEDTAYFLPRGFNEVDRIKFADLNENEFWLAFRSTVGSADRTLPLPIAQREYVIEQEFEVEIQNTKAFLVKVRME